MGFSEMAASSLGEPVPVYLEDNQRAAPGVKGQVGPSLVLRGCGLQKLWGLIQDEVAQGR